MSQQKDQQEAQYATVLQSDPSFMQLWQQYQSALQAWKTAGRANPRGMQSGPEQSRVLALQKAVNQRAVDLGIPSEFQPIYQGGNVGVDHKNWFERHPVETGLLIGSAVLGGGLIANAVGAGTGVGATAGSAGVNPISGATIAPADALGGSATTAGTAAATTGATTGGPAAATVAKAGGAGVLDKVTGGWKDLAFDLGKGALGTFFAHRAANQANKDQQQATNQANAGLAPYANIGGQAFSTLGSLMGLGGAGGGTPPPDPVNANAQPGTGSLRNLDASALQFTAPTQAMTGGATLGTLARQTQSGYRTVPLQSPDGTETMEVPADLVQHYLSRGARPVGA